MSMCILLLPAFLPDFIKCRSSRRWHIHLCSQWEPGGLECGPTCHLIIPLIAWWNKASTSLCESARLRRHVAGCGSCGGPPTGLTLNSKGLLSRVWRPWGAAEALRITASTSVSAYIYPTTISGIPVLHSCPSHHHNVHCFLYLLLRWHCILSFPDVRPTAVPGTQRISNPGVSLCTAPNG